MQRDGLITLRSPLGAGPTVARLKEAIAAAGLTLFAHIDQAAAARDVGLELAPLDLLLFGNPRAGTLLMNAHPLVGIDLPLRALVWQDAKGATWVGFNDPAWIAARHGLGAGSSEIVAGMARLQATLAAATALTKPG